ncbi:dihydropteroate synthase [Prosthecochloris ethylica]
MMQNNLLTCRDATLNLSGDPLIMGVVNTTPDSFYDGGRHQDAPLHHARSLMNAGAAIIDIGGESTRPGSQEVDTEEEIRRTAPLISELRRESDIVISIDTWKSAVAEEALRAGADIVNDISGFTFDPDIADVCRRYRAGAVLMHTFERPDRMRWSTDTDHEHRDIVHIVKNSLRASVDTALEYGVENLILDPGFGFGKSAGENFELLGRFRELQELGKPLLAGLSRKSFLGWAVSDSTETVPPPEERLAATIAANTIAVMNGAAVLRVHDVREACHAARIARAVMTAQRSSA